MSLPQRQTAGCRQSGIVLYATLIILIVMSLLGLTAARGSALQVKMARNIFELNQARQAAESALIDAEAWLTRQTTVPQERQNCNSPCAKTVAVWATDAAGDPLNFDWANNGRKFGYDYEAKSQTRDINDVVTQPRYRIELIGSEADSLTLGLGLPTAKYYYAVTAQGNGITAQSDVIVQSAFERRYR